MTYVVIFIILFILLRKYRIKWKTFFRKGFKPVRGPFGVYCYCGKQGKGKTYSVVEFILENSQMKVFSNVHLKGVKYTYFHGLTQLLELRQEKDCIIVYDEIFTLLTKQSKITTDVLDFLSQMRKRGIIFITTAQEWLEINMTLRRYCRYQIQCDMRNYYICGILIKSFYDAEEMKWSEIDNEYVAPLLKVTISKCNVRVVNSYDTFEQIAN